MHTFPSEEPNLRFSLAVTPSAVCPGDTVSVTVHITNAGPTVAGFDPVLSMSCPGDAITKLLVANLGRRNCGTRKLHSYWNVRNAQLRTRQHPGLHLRRQRQRRHTPSPLATRAAILITTSNR